MGMFPTQQLSHELLLCTMCQHLKHINQCLTHPVNEVEIQSKGFHKVTVL